MNNFVKAMMFLDELWDEKVLPQLKPCFVEYSSTIIGNVIVNVFLFDLSKIPDTYTAPFLLDVLSKGFLLELKNNNEPVATYTYHGNHLYIIDIVS
ncbi:hypothetical protein KAR91_84235 [Candidatus Pacearchaeota archaeon]|nr:hypothetical protein [Candidatus Pacearchaeota archaeon]